MKVYITQYALSKGILERDAEIALNISDDMIKINTDGYTNYYHKPDWYFDRQEAIEHAEVMRKKKIDSLKKQIKKLENLKFE